MGRDAVGLLFWVLRWHEGRRVSHRVLYDVLWGASVKPANPKGMLHDVVARVRTRYGQRWIVEDCAGRAFRILPGANVPELAVNAGQNQNARPDGRRAS